MSYIDEVREKHMAKFKNHMENGFDELIEAVVSEATETETNAGYSGLHTDGGASRAVERLEMFLAGFDYAHGGNLPSEYADILGETS